MPTNADQMQAGSSPEAGQVQTGEDQEKTRCKQGSMCCRQDATGERLVVLAPLSLHHPTREQSTGSISQAISRQLLKQPLLQRLLITPAACATKDKGHLVILLPAQRLVCCK